MKLIKKISMMVVMFAFIWGFGATSSKAANVSIGLSSGQTSIGGNVTATVNVSGDDVSQYDIYVTYDPSVLQFVSGSGSAQANGSGGTIRLVGGAGATSLTFTAVGNGTSSISTSGSEVYDINYNQVSVSHAGASVTVATKTTEAPQTTTTESGNTEASDSTTEADDTTTEDDGRSSNCNLASLQISPGTLSPAFSPSTTYYSVEVDEDVTSMVVSATCEDEKSSVKVSGAGLIEPGDNTVTITVTAENGAVKVYTLGVTAGESKGAAKVNIDGVEYSFVQSEDEIIISIPEGYETAEGKYKDSDVLTFISPNKKICIVCLLNEAGEQKFFYYVEKDELFAPYYEFSPEQKRFVILPMPKDAKLTEDFIKCELRMPDVKDKFEAYQSDKYEDKDMYLVYGAFVDGTDGLFWYDAKNSSFVRFFEANIPEVVTATPTVATPQTPYVENKVEVKSDEGFFTRKTFMITSIVLAVITFMLIVILIVVCISSKYDKEYDEEYDEKDENNENDEDNKDNMENAEAVDEIIADETADETVDETADETVDKTVDEIVDETADADNSETDVPVDESTDADIADMGVDAEVPAENSVDEVTDADKVKVDVPVDMPVDVPAKIPTVDADISSIVTNEAASAVASVAASEALNKKSANKVNNKVKENVTEVTKIPEIKINGKLPDTEFINKIREEINQTPNDYEEQYEFIKKKLSSDYDAEKDSAFSDDE